MRPIRKQISGLAPMARRVVATITAPVMAVAVIPFVAQPATAAPVENVQAQSSIGTPAPGPRPGEATGNAPRNPIRTEYPKVEGLPEGVSINRVEWLTNREVALYVNSKAMPGKPLQVRLLLPRDWHAQPDRKFPTVWAMDGLRAREDHSGWTLETNIESHYADKNVLVVMPVGGQSSFYSDWQQPDKGKHYKWETYLIDELLPVLSNGWRANDDRAIYGLSMGGTAVMNLATRHPKLWKFAGSFSGYLDTTSTGMPQAIGGAMQDAGGYDAQKMWGPYGSKDWHEHDPKQGVHLLKDMTVYVSSGSGNTGAWDKDSNIAGIPTNTAGFGLEVLSRMTSQTFVNAANAAGVKVISRFRPSGTHSWPYWQYEMGQAWPYIADALKLPEGDRGAKCTSGGEIGKYIAKNPKLGACVGNEYPVAGGKGVAQQYQHGTMYWSAKTGAHPVMGRIGARYAEAGGPGSALGFPTSGERVTPDRKGRYNTFQNGAIYWTPQTGAHIVFNDVFKVWGESGWEKGPLGYPTGSRQKVGDGVRQQFQKGAVYLNPQKKGAVLYGAIEKKYLDAGGPAESPLGWPKPAAKETKVKGGSFNAFDKGNIYFSRATGANYILYGPIFDEWGKKKWENGPYGFPSADFERPASGGERQKFQHGTIEQHNGVVKGSRN
ncbi:alpha/beta hydrolase-fold protein [Corynebacterium ulceribovis]|uniref:alpha/beta hydrolase-fold protein n=1 Tax=Corynebacterium ulceribovis TaxID=487732 RepID=UPI00035DD867|nr:alpha/beta hydrolase-fold protein [Corynebacterium ulceribovis]